MIEVLLPRRGFYGFSHMWIKTNRCCIFYINCFVHFISSLLIVIAHLSAIMGYVNGVDSLKAIPLVAHLFCFISIIYMERCFNLLYTFLPL